MLKQHNPNKCVHKKQKGNKSGQLETIKCLKFIHTCMWDRVILNVGNGKFIGGLLYIIHGFWVPVNCEAKRNWCETKRIGIIQNEIKPILTKQFLGERPDKN